MLPLLWLPVVLATAWAAWNAERIGEWFLRNSVDGSVLEPTERGRRVSRGWDRWLGRGFAVFLLAVAVWWVVKPFLGGAA